MVERRVCPTGRVVAGVARLRESRGNVVRHVAAKSLRAVPIRRVARVTGGVRGREIVIVVGVATGARRRGMDAG